MKDNYSLVQQFVFDSLIVFLVLTPRFHFHLFPNIMALSCCGSSGVHVQEVMQPQRHHESFEGCLK